MRTWVEYVIMKPILRDDVGKLFVVFFIVYGDVVFGEGGAAEAGDTENPRAKRMADDCVCCLVGGVKLYDRMSDYMEFDERIILYGNESEQN